MGKKKFIDKKKAATFQLLARDSSDPIYDNDAPGSDRVFVRVDNNPYSVDSFFQDDISGNGLYGEYDADQNGIFADAPDDVDDCCDVDGNSFGSSMRSEEQRFSGASRAPLPESVRREILELGFPDDGYNYLIHLREIKNTGGGAAFYQNPKARLDQLPLDVKAYDASRVRVSEMKSDDTNDKSIYNVASKTVSARIQKVVDAEVAAMLDDSDLSRFGSDVEDLEEDFVVCANIPEEGEDDDIDKQLNFPDQPEVINEAADGHATSACRESAVADVGECKVGIFPLEVGDGITSEKSRAHRLLDEQFDLLQRQEYDTEDEDDYHDGYVAEADESLADKLKHALNDEAMDDLELHDKYEGPADLLHSKDRPKNKQLLDSAADVIRRCAEYAEKYENGDEDEDVIVVQESSNESEEWDCETIVSTYSNLDNHPAKIGAPEAARKKKLAESFSCALKATSPVISLGGKEKLPVDFLPGSRKSATEKVNAAPQLKAEQQKRKQHGQESKEEKRERKAAVKEEKREARRAKKEMKELYRSEAQRAQRVAAVTGPSSIHLM